MGTLMLTKSLLWTSANNTPLTSTYGGKSNWAAGSEEPITAAPNAGHRDQRVPPSAHGTPTVQTAGPDTWSTSAFVLKKKEEPVRVSIL